MEPISSQRVSSQRSPSSLENAPVQIGSAELRRATEILSAVVGDRGLLAQLGLEERRALLSAAGRVSRPDRDAERHLRRTFKKKHKSHERATDRGLKAGAGIRAAREATVFAAPERIEAPDARGQPELRVPKNCYVCKQEFTRLHFFYDALCPACADFNYAKRFQSAPLNGCVALITGSRLKIGYQAALKLLRAGAHVIATTRFPHDSAQRYAREPDFVDWRERLEIHGLDLRHSPSVEIFARFINSTHKRLDILINNAAQTVRRPVGFYRHMLGFEELPWRELPEALRGLLRAHEHCKSALVAGRGGAEALTHQAVDSTGLSALGPLAGAGAGIGIRESAALSQLRYTYDDQQSGREIFPEGQTDADLQQLDLRAHNSWRMRLAEVSTPELLEVQLVNAVSPFILCAKLKPLMLREPTGSRHIVNVSAMEGIFSRGTKTDKHPHTNMAKAALNMLTLTSAPDYARDGIFMNAVDTGWVTDEDPAAHAARKRTEHDFQPPLDIVDGAARICDPFFAGLLSGTHLWGKFLKDYKPSSW